MKRSLLISFALLLSGVAALPVQQVMIGSPLPGEALQGQVTITGTTDVNGLQSYDVSFAYQNDTTDTWFLIGSGDQALRGAALATWDTTTITDGAYRLRVRTHLADGRTLERIIGGLRVRNYTPIETNTPGVTPQSTESVTPSAAVDTTGASATVTPLPGNPAALSQVDLEQSLVLGGLGALGLFILLFVYIGLRSLFRRGR